MYGDPEIRGRLAQLGVDINELDKRLLAAPAKPTVPRADEAATSASLRRSARRIATAQQQLQGFSGYSKYTPESELEFDPAKFKAQYFGKTPEELRTKFGAEADDIIAAKQLMFNRVKAADVKFTP